MFWRRDKMDQHDTTDQSGRRAITKTYSSSFHLLILLLICLLPHKAAFSTSPPSPPYSQKCVRPFARPLSVQDTAQTRHTRRQICVPLVGFEPTISTAKRWKNGRLRPRCHCDWYVFHFLLPYFFRGFTFHLEPQHGTSTFSRPVTYIQTRHKNHLLCTSVSLHGRVVTDLACHTEDGIYSCLSHETHSAQLTRLCLR